MFFCFFGVFLYQGLGRGSRSTALAALRWLGLSIPLLFVFNGLFGMIGLVWTQVAADALMTAITFLVIRRDTRKWK